MYIFAILVINNNLLHLLHLNGLSPQYLADDCQLITTTGRRRLRSSNVDNLLPATFHEPAQLWAIDPSLLLVHISLWLWTIAFRVSPVTENAFVWLKTAAPSDLLLDVVRFTNVLTYLLT